MRPEYRVVTVGLYDDQVRTLDQTALVLQQAGLSQANRSFLVQALVRAFAQEVDGKGADEILQLVFDRYLRRPLARAESRAQPDRQESQSGSPQKRRTSGMAVS